VRRKRHRSSRDGHAGEASAIAAPGAAAMLKPDLTQLAAMPPVQYPGEGPHPDKHGKDEVAGAAYGQGRFFQTGRTLGSVVARVCHPHEQGDNAAFCATAQPPLVTTHKNGSRVELAAVCSIARAAGLRPGMALTMARAQVPEIEVRPADAPGDAADLRRLAEILTRRWSPVVAVCDSQGLFIDLTGVAHLHGGEERFGQRLVRLLARRGVTARLAIADTAGAAWALARHGDDAAVQIIRSGEHVRALAPLPPAALRLDSSALELLTRLGVTSIGELLTMPRAPLVRRFGQAIVTRLDQASGYTPEPLVPVISAEGISVSQAFAEPIATAEVIEHWLRQLTYGLAEALGKAGQGARSIELVAARVDGVPQRLRIGLARPNRDPAHLLRLMLRRIEDIEPGYGIDRLALHVRRAEPLAPQPFGTVLVEQPVPDLATLVDAIINRIGPERLWRVAPVESDVPERCWRYVAPLEAAQEGRSAWKRDDVRQLDKRAPDHPWHPRWPRPVRLLPRPERVDHVLAELPDQPPKRFTWRGQSYRVVRAEGPERICGEWWRRPAERQAVRDYFWVEDESGQRFWLYRRGDGVRDGTGDLTWYLHGRAG
jgi:protein ImuB